MQTLACMCVHSSTKNTPGEQKSKAKSEAPISSYIHLTKNVISDRGQGLGCLLKYHKAINVYHLLLLLASH